VRVALSLLIAMLLPLAAAAQTAAPAKPGAGRDQPIEINADALEVQQEKQVAIFSGNVDATQGDMKLKADQLKVFYRQGAKAGEPARPQATGGSPAGAIVRIEATGRVFVSSPTQTAQGDQGVFDVERNTITLTSRVVITQDKNVVRGDRLVMNLTTGQARMDGQSRVHGLFVPSKEGQQ
jgi:lipopolysaccharide export system protein LptA